MGLKEIKRQFVIGLTLLNRTKHLLRSERQQEAISLNLLRRSIVPSPPESWKLGDLPLNDNLARLQLFNDAPAILKEI
jgi:hypothetical protein